MKGSITISKKGATFTAYKLLDATKSGDAYEYSVNSDLKDFFNNSKYGSYSQESIQKLNGEEVKEFAVNLHKYILDNKKSGQELTDGQKNTVDLGYYLVTETSSDSEGAAVASTPIIVSVPQVSGDSWNYDVTINPKDNTPILEKNIVKENQRVKTSSENIGDVIKYEVKASIPVYQKNAQDIMYKFTDTMSKGLKYDEKTGFKVTSGDKVFDKDNDYTKEILAGYSKENNPLPASYIVRLESPEVASSVESAMKTNDKFMAGVEDVGNDEELIGTINSFVKVINTVGLVLGVVFVGVSLFLIVNTIKITVYSRRREVGIMKFVGATDWFIRWPFVIEGVIIGLVGGILSTLLLFAGYNFLYGKIVSSSSLYMPQFVQPMYVLTTMSWQFILAGIVIGAIGSIIALRKFLDV